MDESDPNPAAFSELRSATDLALRATKMTDQVIGRSIASLVVLERHLRLNLTEMKDADKISFLDSPVSPTGLFGPAVEGFAERFTAAQKSSQAMWHFLPKRSSSAANSSRPKKAPTQQPPKASQSPSPSQSVSDDAGPHGLSVFGTSVGPASYVVPSVLAETLSSSTRLASRMSPCHG